MGKTIRTWTTGCLVSILLISCGEKPAKTGRASTGLTTYYDTAFFQEYHEPWPFNEGIDREVRRIAVDREMNVWVATRSGIYVKREGQREWLAVFPPEDRGPSFSVILDRDSSVWMSTWKGVYRARNGMIEHMKGARAPIGVLAPSKEGVYALGPHGVWLYNSTGSEKKNYDVARSVRDAISDNNGGLWVATDVGLYHLEEQGVRNFSSPDYIASAYVRTVCYDRAQNLWAAGLGGASILNGGKKLKALSVKDGLPSIQVNTIEGDGEGVMWAGTDKGVVRYRKSGPPDLLFSRRWLLNDKVNDIAFDRKGTAWIATGEGVSAIKKKKMTLAGKARYFYDVLMRRHIREPWIAGQCKLTVPGDTSVWNPDDDDNDGEYTANYLAMESFRYAATKDPQARENAGKAFRFLRLLQEVTDTNGFFARTIVPSTWKNVDDPNRSFDERQLADELVKEPRFKPVQKRWHKSKDGKWLWKGDTSSDEMGGHMMGYYFYYELVADEAEKKEVSRHVSNIIDHLIANDFNLVDVDGTHTRWGVWSPSLLNRDPEWAPDRSLNSMELLSFLKLAHHVTGEKKYQDVYLKLIDQEGYLRNMANIPHQNPGWFIYFDVMLAAYQYPILLRCEKDPDLLAFYEKHLDSWFERYKGDQNPLINFIYCYSRSKRAGLAASVYFLKDAPLDLIDWPIDHTERADVEIVNEPVMDDIQLDKMPPASIRGAIRWDKNPWAARSGNPYVEREPVFWLLPYWMGRYLQMIQPLAGSR
jgi:hypothetical protein